MKTESLGECHVKMEAEVRVMDLQGKGCWPSPEARGAGDGNTFSLRTLQFSSVQSLSHVRALGRNQMCPQLELGLLLSSNVREHISVR